MTEQDQYLELLTKSGKRKYKATMLLPYGDQESRFEAAVLFHEAAAIEEQALSLLDKPSVEVRLGATIERCACLVLGMDVVGSTQAWREVERLSLELSPEIASIQRERLDPLYHSMQRDVEELLRRSPVFMSAQLEWGKIAEADKPQARAELSALLDRFPGESVFHFNAAMAALDERRLDEAGRAALRAYRLQPWSSAYRWLLLLFVADSIASPDGALSPAEAERHLARTYEELQREPAEPVVYLGFMMASLAAFLVMFFRGEDASLHRERALWAAEVGAKRPAVGSQDVSQLIEGAGLVIKLLTAQPGAFMTIVESVLGDMLRDMGIDLPPSSNGGARPTPASVIRTMTRVAALRFRPRIDLAA